MKKRYLSVLCLCLLCCPAAVPAGDLADGTTAEAAGGLGRGRAGGARRRAPPGVLSSIPASRRRAEDRPRPPTSRREPRAARVFKPPPGSAARGGEWGVGDAARSGPAPRSFLPAPRTRGGADARYLALG